MNDTELLLKMYEDNRHQAQLHEDRRATATAIIGGGAGALFSAIVNEGIRPDDFPLAWVLVVVGVFGFLLAAKATERMRLHNDRCQAFLRRINDLNPDVDILAIKETSDRRHRAKHRISHWLNLSRLWQLLHVLIAAAGIAVVLHIDPQFFSRNAASVAAFVSGLIHH